MALFTVTNLNDSGAGSLRQAIIDANALAGTDTIEFSDTISGGTIVLTSGQLSITDSVIIDGDEDGDLKADVAISGNNASRVFLVATPGITADLSSLTLEDGLAATGGAIYAVSGSQLNLTHSTISDSAADSGGAVLASDTRIASSTFTGNSATFGGALYLRSGTATITNVTLEGNTANDAGGAIIASTAGGTPLAIDNSTIVGNTLRAGATYDGAGVATFGGGVTEISNSILSGNTGGRDFAGVTGNPGLLTAQSSLVGTTTVISTDNGGNLFSDTPGVAALADNGGAVQTRALDLTSLAIAAGDASILPADAADVDNDGDTAEILPIDANGNPRIIGTLDMGAAEVALASVVVDTLVDEDDGDFSAGDLSLREALGLVAPGGTITFDAGITGGTTPGVDDGVITLGGSRLIINQDVTINGDVNGDDRADITIDANDSSRVISVVNSADAGLHSLTLTGGFVDQGGALRAYGGSVVDVVHSTIEGNYTTVRGGGIYNQGATFNIVNSLVTGNNSRLGAGRAIYQSSGTSILTNTTVSGNDSGGYGLAFGNGAASFFNSTITDNVFAYFGQLNGTNSIFTDNIY